MEKWYKSIAMGNIVKTRREVCSQMIESLVKYKTVDVLWKIVCI